MGRYSSFSCILSSSSPRSSLHNPPTKLNINPFPSLCCQSSFKRHAAYLWMTCTSVKLFQIGLFGQRVQLWRCRLKRIWALVWVEYICYDFSFIHMLFISLSYLLHHHPIFLLMTYLIRLLVVCISSFSYSLHFYPILSASIYHLL